MALTWACRAAWAVLVAGLLGIAVTAWAKLPAAPQSAAEPATAASKVGRDLRQQSDVPTPFRTFIALTR